MIKNNFPELLLKTDQSSFVKNQIDQKAYDYKVNYSKESLAFNQAYFLKNLYKCLIALTYLDQYNLLQKQPICDIGCGGGCFTLAYQLVFGRVDANLIDKSSSQLAIAKQICTDFNVSFCNCDLSSDILNNQNLNLYSYSLGEQSDIKNTNLGDNLLLIDYPEVIESFVQCNKDNYMFFCCKCSTILDESSSGLIHENNLEVNFCLAVSKKYLVNQYFEIWNNYQTDKLQDLFANKLVYNICPKNKSLNSIDMIKEYWLLNSVRQSDLKLYYKIINQENNLAKVSFIAHFYDIIKSQKILVDGIMTLHFDFNKIVVLEEFYKKYTI